MATLLDHQRDTMNYLFRVAPDQKGLVVGHYMGTGKTITALTFLQNQPDKVAIIVHPHGLRHIWREDAKKLGVTVDLHKFVTYAELQDFLGSAKSLAGHVLVCDEAHYLSQMLEAAPTRDALRLYKTLVTADRVMLLTGTPIYNSENDFRWLVNIAAGKPVLPLLAQEYRRLFFSRKLIQSVVHTWAVPLVRHGIVAVTAVEVGRWCVNLYRPLRSAQELDIRTLLTIGSSLLSGDVSYIKMMYSEEDVAKVTGMFSALKKPVGTVTSTVGTLLQGAFLRKDSSLAFVAKQGFSLLSPIILYIIMSVAASLLLFFEPSDFYYLDTKKAMRACGRYISLFELPNSAKDANSPFPTVTVTRRPVQYTPAQLRLWVSLTWRSSAAQAFSKLLPADLHLPCEDATVSDAAAKLVGNKAVGSASYWRDVGRVIGNMPEGGQPSNKLGQMLQEMEKVGNQRVVIYSNFWEQGSLLIAAHLKERGLKYAIIAPDTLDTQAILHGFAQGVVPILILHPKMTEGLSVMGARQLHIMEPFLSYSMQQQLVARVSRYLSHAMLPLPQRRVDVFQWYASVQSPIAKAKTHMEALKQWFFKESHLNYFRRTMEYTQDATPDFLAMQNMQKLQGLVDELKKNTHLTSTALTKDESKMKKCCIWEPDVARMQSCMNSLQRRCT